MIKILYLAIASLFLLFGCTTHKNSNQITVSIPPQKFIVQKLLGDTAKVNIMVTSGNSPATYSPTPSQLKQLQLSSLYLCIGYIGFEHTWIPKFKSINKHLIINDTSVGIDPIKNKNIQHGDHCHEEGIDPHIWTSPKAMIHIVKNTADALIEYYPNLKTPIQNNAKILINRINEIDSWFTKERSNFIYTKFMIFHPAYTYLARDYNLEQISIENDGKEPSAKWLQQLIQLSKQEMIKAVFIQKEFDSRHANVIAEELKIPIIEVNPLAEDWEKETIKTLNSFIVLLK